MNTEQSKPVSHIRAGLMISAAIILLSVVMSLFSGNGDPNGGWISYLIIIIGVSFFVQQYGKARQFQPGFGELFSYGFKTTTIIALCFVVYLLVLSQVAPQLKEAAMEATRQQLETSKNLSESDVDQALKLADRFFWILLIGTSLFFFVFIGAIGALLGAAITKKGQQPPIEQNFSE